MYRVRRSKVQEEPSVFRHWYRVCGTDYLRLAKAYGQQGVGAGMQRLGPSSMNAVQPVVRYLETALALLREPYLEARSRRPLHLSFLQSPHAVCLSGSARLRLSPAAQRCHSVRRVTRRRILRRKSLRGLCLGSQLECLSLKAVDVGSVSH